MLADLFAALSGLISTVLELVFHAVVLLVGEVSAAIAYLFRGREAGRRARERAQVVTYVVLMLAFFGLAVAAWVGSAKWRRQHAARELVQRQCEALAANRDPKGRPVDPPPELLVDDPWGKPIAITVDRGLVHDTVRVRSAGPDGVEGTDDDISETRRVLLDKKAVGEEVGDRLKGFVADQIDRFRDKEEERPEEE